jgi:hypothetical protein
MAIFLLAALAAYFIYEPLARWWTVEVDQLDAENIQRHKISRILALAYYGSSKHRGIIAAMAALLVLGIALYAMETGSASFRFVRFVLTAPETTDAVLGALAGVVWRTFPNWRFVAGLGSTSRISIFAGAIASLALVSLLAPHLWRLKAFETPYAKFQFATPQAETQLELEIQRDLAFYERVSEVTRTSRIIQYDCGYAAVAAGGFAAFKENKQALFRSFGDAIAFRKKLLDYLIRIQNAEHQGYDIERLKRNVSVIADELYNLLPNQRLVNSSQQNTTGKKQTVDEAYKAAREKLSSQAEMFKRNGIGNDMEASETDFPGWCSEAKGDITEDGAKELIDNTRYLYGTIGVMFAYTGNTEGVIKVFRAASERVSLKKDINVNAGLAEALFVGEREFRDVSRYYENALEAIEFQAKKVDQFCNDLRKKPSTKIAKTEDEENDNAVCDEHEGLPRRYKRARRNIQLRLA